MAEASANERMQNVPTRDPMVISTVQSRWHWMMPGDIDAESDTDVLGHTTASSEPTPVNERVHHVSESTPVVLEGHRR